MAGFPVTAGASSFSGGYIPEIWSMKLIREFYSMTFLSEISNTEFEGEITKSGDTVHINTLPEPTINDFVKDEDLVYENMVGSQVDLVIDKGKYWAFPASDIDKKQANIDFVNKWTEHCGKKLKISMETGILADIYSDADSDNSGTTAGKSSNDINLGVSGTPRAVTKDNILDILVDIGTVLDEQDVPEDERYILIPPWMGGMVKKSDLKDASLSGDGKSVLRTGRLGMVDRLILYSSNLVNHGTDGIYNAYNVIAGHKYALAFASQIVENEKLRNYKTFGDLVRGLQVYGYKVIKPEALVHLYCYKG